MIHQRLWLRVLIGMALGACVGFALSPFGGGMISEASSDIAAEWIAIPGRVFLGLIGMVIVPLIICSIILGINGSENALFVKRIGMLFLPYVLVTSFISVMIGIGLAEWIGPGRMVPESLLAEAADFASEHVVDLHALDDLSIPDRIQNLIPTNPLRAALEMDLLPLVFGAIFVGIVILNIPRPSVRAVVELCESIQAICLKIIEWIMRIAPLAVFGLIAEATIRLGPSAFVGLGWYVFTVLAGLLCILVMYLCIVTLLGRRSPFAFLKSVRAVQLLAFSTSSSAAVMPVSLQTAEDKLGIHPDTARFIIPLGTMVNMDGTGLYQAVAAVFLCQLFGVDLSFAEMLLLTMTVVGASIGTPATPGVGIVILAGIITSLGVPAAGVGLILGVDRILDMCRTMVNVTGDLAAVTVMERWLHHDDIKPPPSAR